MSGQNNSDYENYYVPEQSKLAIFASLTLQRYSAPQGVER